MPSIHTSQAIIHLGVYFHSSQGYYSMTERLTITRPDDWHLHVRDGAVLQHTVPATARVMQRAIIMPNLNPPVMNAEQALEYRARILAQAPKGSTFDPLMVLCSQSGWSYCCGKALPGWRNHQLGVGCY